jgi:hypothetical protein
MTFRVSVAWEIPRYIWTEMRSWRIRATIKRATMRK